MKYLGIIFFIFLFFSQGAAADKTPQKVGVTIDKESAYSNISLIIRKALLSDLTNQQKIYLLTDNEEVLLSLGVETLNARMMIDTEQAGNMYQFKLYDVRENTTNLIKEGFELATNDFPDKMENITGALSEIILSNYPPVDKKVLKEYKVETRTISIFETDKPTWKLGLDVLYQSRNTHFRIDNTNYGLNAGDALSSSGIGFYFQGNFQYLNANINSGLLYAPSATHDAMLFNLGASAGIFKSLLVVGLDFIIGYMRTKHDGTMIAEYSLSDTNDTQSSLVLPDINMWSAGIAEFFQFNMTPSFYVQLKLGWFLFGNYIHLDFPETSPVSDMENNLLRSSGMNFVHLNINYGINEQMRLSFNYIMLNMQYKSWSFEENSVLPSDIYQQVDIGVDNLYFQNISIADTYIGIGYEYVF